MPTYERPVTRRQALDAAHRAAEDATVYLFEAESEADPKEALVMATIGNGWAFLASFYLGIADNLRGIGAPVQVPLTPDNVDASRVRYTPDSA